MKLYVREGASLEIFSDEVFANVPYENVEHLPPYPKILPSILMMSPLMPGTAMLRSMCMSMGLWQGQAIDFSSLTPI